MNKDNATTVMATICISLLAVIMIFGMIKNAEYSNRKNANVNTKNPVYVGAIGGQS